MASPYIMINNQPIAWSFIQYVRRCFGGDWDQTIDCFWKAKDKTGPNAIIRYISKGLVPDAQGKRYMFTMSKDREDGKMETLRDWWSKLYQHKPKKNTMTVKEAMGELFKQMSEGKPV